MSSVETIHDHIRVLRTGATIQLQLDRPAAMNAFSRSILERLDQFFVDLTSDESCRVLIITGTGKAFVAGADIGEYDQVTPEQFDSYQRLGRSVFDGLEQLPQYTIAAVNGYALGGGFEFALCCDEIMAVEQAKFGLPEVKLGLLPGGGGSQRLSRALGERFTKRLLVTGELVPATELYRRGLIGSLSTTWEDLNAAASQLATAVANAAPLPVRQAKALVNHGRQLDLPSALTYEQKILSDLYATQDAHEGIRAFIEKRSAIFIGR